MSKKMESIFTEIFRLFLRGAGTIFLVVSLFMMGNTAIDLFLFKEPTNDYEVDNAQWECRERVYEIGKMSAEERDDSLGVIEEIEDILEQGSLNDSPDVVVMKKEILETLEEGKVLFSADAKAKKIEFEKCLVTETEKNRKYWEIGNVKTLIYGGLTFVIGVVLLLTGRRRK